MSSAEEVCAQHIYKQLGNRDLAHIEKRIAELKDPGDRWRMHLAWERARREQLLCSFTNDPDVVEEPEKEAK